MRILLVEDDATTLALLEKSLLKWGYETVTATDGSKAMSVLEQTQVDMIVSDWLMPRMNGLELCEQVRNLELNHYIYIILISAQDTRTDVVRGLEGGVDDFIAKPLNLEELRARLEIGVRVIKLERELNQKYLTIKRNYYQTLHMFTQFLETYNEKLGGHSRRVGKLSLALAKAHTDIRPEAYPVIEAAGMLHDVGLIGLPDTLVSKRLVEMNGEEKELYRTHPSRGEAILSQIDLLKPVARIVRMHHEQHNGRGFPDGLAGEDIALDARIVAAASLYDNFHYVDGIALKELPEQLQQCRGYQIDPRIVDLLLEINLREIRREAQQVDREIDLEELEAGMVLARDVRMKTGAFVMAAGTGLEETTITKLKRYFELGNIIGTVFVRK